MAKKKKKETMTPREKMIIDRKLEICRSNGVEPTEENLRKITIYTYWETLK
jgi:hypothetical protein